MRAMSGSRRQSDAPPGPALGDPRPRPGAGRPRLRDRPDRHPEGRAARSSTSPASPKPRRSSAACPRKATGSAPPTPRSRSRSSTTCSARAAATTSSARSPPWPKTTPGPATSKLLYRHYSISESPLELGFYGAEAAAAQGYGWQYTYLFFRNQDEAERFGVDQDFLDSIAGGDRGTQRARMGRIPGRRTAAPAGRSPSGSKATRTRHRPRHPHPARRRSSAGRAAPGRSRTAPAWPRSKQAIEAVQ